ncbi:MULTISPECIES: hypothetical protein [unclassified Pseudomonas]|uniref:hypothetical protein n=1 Tax=unclassified Pseudomonas TaxID=196821 RepID=UPI00257D8F2B|nr:MULTISPECIES: hypothetical protein [unclassified Pseudomonas]
MTAFQPTQVTFAFPQSEVAVQLPERSLEQKIEGDCAGRHRDDRARLASGRGLERWHHMSR